MNFATLKKIESSGARPVQSADDDVVTAIIKVNVPNYVPEGIKVRAPIGPYLFTAEFFAKELRRLESDSRVVTISVSRPMPLQKLPTP